ncbi:17771_t:CDS:2 [Entrophospora sp. SA101]|nr:17771_t:CDS:2 [Entrophospora sp. SA101]
MIFRLSYIEVANEEEQKENSDRGLTALRIAYHIHIHIQVRQKYSWLQSDIEVANEEEQKENSDRGLTALRIAVKNLRKRTCVNLGVFNLKNMKHYCHKIYRRHY